PIQTLIHAIQEVAKGNFQTKINIEHPKEFRDLSKSFNQMTDELASIELLRSDFINNFSHEFKSPIVSISGFARLIKSGNLSEEEQQEYLDIIILESSRLSELTTNVL
ncbi:histidine kinase dimerization/phospho-acceptor domain-containing protein, partial [Parabacteroides distasonis]